MSETKHCQKWSKTATTPDLESAARELRRGAAGTANLMVRSSMLQRVQIIETELRRRHMLRTIAAQL